MKLSVMHHASCSFRIEVSDISILSFQSHGCRRILNMFPLTRIPQITCIDFVKGKSSNIVTLAIDFVSSS